MPGSASQQIDRNHKVINSNEAFVTSTTIVFDGTAGKGAQGTTTRFTVTGDIVMQVFGVCNVSLEGASATISVGNATTATGYITTTTATGLDTGLGWRDNSPSTIETLSSAPYITPSGIVINTTVATADITGGSLTIYIVWRPLGTSGNVTVA